MKRPPGIANVLDFKTGPRGLPTNQIMKMSSKLTVLIRNVNRMTYYNNPILCDVIT